MFFGIGKFKWIRSYLLRRYRDFNNNRAKKKIQEHVGLWAMLEYYLKNTKSTGCSYCIYWTLYNYIKKNKPKEILECSTGITTIVMAYALMENEIDGHGSGRITSMEESQEYYDLAHELLPSQLDKYVEILYSPKVEAYYYFFRGVKYRDKPLREYDFVFIDGPTTSAPSDGQKTFDMDFIEVVAKSDIPIDAVVDFRVSTCYVLSKILGRKKLRLDINSIGYITGCTKHDLKTTSDIVKEYRE